MMERFSITKDTDKTVNQSKLLSNHMKLMQCTAKRGETSAERVTIGFGFTSD